MTLPTWAPSVEDVKALLPRRPEFTSSSRPSYAQVLDIIGKVAANIESELSSTPIAARLFGKASDVAALSAAARVERTFYPEQSTDSDSTYALLYAEYQAELLGLRSLASTQAVGGSGRSVRFTTWTACPVPDVSILPTI